MKKVSTVLFLFTIGLFVFGTTSANAQEQRNPVLEFCTGTWCQWCPCGDFTIEDDILPNIPNAIILAYHGPANTTSDPFSFFPGNTIIGSLELISFPTGAIDRVTGIQNWNSGWVPNVTSRANVPATVHIDIERSFDLTSREFSATINFTALDTLEGEYKYNVILVEDGITHGQTSNNTCTPGRTYISNFVHYWVVRDMMNGALGEDVVNGHWSQGQMISKTITHTVAVPPSPSPDMVFDSCRVVVLVYKVGGSLNSSSEIQQADTWALIPPNYVATISSSSADVLADNTTNADFDAVIHNQGVQTDKYDLSLTTNAPSGWNLSYTDVNGTYQMGEIDSVEVAPNDSTIVTVHVNPSGINGTAISTLNFVSKNLPANHGSVNMRNVTTTGVNMLVVDANDNEYESYVDSSIQRVYSGSYGVVSRDALMSPTADISNFYMLTWTSGTVKPVFNQTEVNMLQSYLDGGGNLLINGQDIGSDIFKQGGQSQFAQGFYHNYLHADFVADTGSSFLITGIAGDPIGDGIQFVLSSTLHDRSPDQISTYDSSATPVLQFLNGPNISSIKADAGNYRVVYFGIGLEQMTSAIRDTLTARSLRWLMENVVLGTKENNNNVPTKFSLSQNYPNPFNPSTKIKYSIPTSAFTTLKVYDILGNEVKTLVNGQMQAGSHEIEFNASTLSSGVYFYKLQSDGLIQTKKMVILK